MKAASKVFLLYIVVPSEYDSCMPTAACGINCEVCSLREACGGCVPGNDPRAEARMKEIEAMMGAPCPALFCATRRGMDYCLACPDFPCGVLYKWEIPYSKTLLDLIGRFKRTLEQA